MKKNRFYGLRISRNWKTHSEFNNSCKLGWLDFLGRGSWTFEIILDLYENLRVIKMPICHRLCMLSMFHFKQWETFIVLFFKFSISFNTREKFQSVSEWDTYACLIWVCLDMGIKMEKVVLSPLLFRCLTLVVGLVRWFGNHNHRTTRHEREI